jgi:hypothetical protein
MERRFLGEYWSSWWCFWVLIILVVCELMDFESSKDRFEGLWIIPYLSWVVVAGDDYSSWSEVGEESMYFNLEGIVISQFFEELGVLDLIGAELFP